MDNEDMNAAIFERVAVGLGIAIVLMMTIGASGLNGIRAQAHQSQLADQSR